MRAPTLQVVDAQVHLWDRGSPLQPADDVHLFRTPERLIDDMDAAGVHQALVTPRMWEEYGNETVLRVAQSYPDRLLAMGTVDLADPLVDARLRHWFDDPGMVCARVIALNHPERLYEGTDRLLWRAAEEFGVPLMVAAPGSLERIGDIAEMHPDLKLTIDHMGLRSGLTRRARERSVAVLLSLSTLENVAVKVSSLPYFAGDRYPYVSLHGSLRSVIEAFGPARCFWGTDLSRLPCTYLEAVTMFTECLDWLDERSLELIMGDALLQWLDRR